MPVAMTLRWNSMMKLSTFQDLKGFPPVVPHPRPWCPCHPRLLHHHHRPTRIDSRPLELTPRSPSRALSRPPLHPRPFRNSRSEKPTSLSPSAERTDGPGSSGSAKSNGHHRHPPTKTKSQESMLENCRLMRKRSKILSLFWPKKTRTAELWPSSAPEAKTLLKRNTNPESGSQNQSTTRYRQNTKSWDRTVEIEKSRPCALHLRLFIQLKKNLLKRNSIFTSFQSCSRFDCCYVSAYFHSIATRSCQQNSPFPLPSLLVLWFYPTVNRRPTSQSRSFTFGSTPRAYLVRFVQNIVSVVWRLFTHCMHCEKFLLVFSQENAALRSCYFCVCFLVCLDLLFSGTGCQI